MMRFTCYLGALILSLWTGGSAHAFGGEDLARGYPWHHEQITTRALMGEEDFYPNQNATFGSAAAHSIAWHADNIDSYLYNPIFWLRGFKESSMPDRTMAALVGFDGLAKLHFDDTFTNRGIQANWERYASGTLIGLYWASEQGPNGDLAAGHHILGVSFHAVQDFYSHSNWVTSPDRRCLTYFETSKASREGDTLFTGAYEASNAGAPVHHGAYSLSCTMVTGDTMTPGLTKLCSTFSPLQNSGVCEHWRMCEGADAVTMHAKNPLPIGQKGTVYLNPKGIALDNTWLAAAQAKNRNLVDESGAFRPGRDGLHFRRDRCMPIIKSGIGNQCTADTDVVFAGTKDLAIRATIEWAEYLEDSMIAMGKGDYWNRLKTQGSLFDQNIPGVEYAELALEAVNREDLWLKMVDKGWTKFTNYEATSAQFEDFAKIPYQFLAAGPYPNANPSVAGRAAAQSANGWYLRVRIKTADVNFAGTDADVFLDVTTPSGVQSILLDYLPTNNREGRVSSPLFVYNDFEAGNDDAYTVGPFAERPSSIKLRLSGGGNCKDAEGNDRNTGDDRCNGLDALHHDFNLAIDRAKQIIHPLVLGLYAGNADYVGEAKNVYTMRDLSGLALRGSSSEMKETLEIRGGDEGEHDVHYTIKRVESGLTDRQRRQGWKSFRIELNKLHTIKESVLDRGSTSDEPFVLFHVAPLSGQTTPSFSYVSPPFEDMDTGEEEGFPGNRSRRSTTVSIPPEGLIVISSMIYESDSETEADRDELLRTFVTNVEASKELPASEFLDSLARWYASDWTPQWIEAYAFQRGAFPQAGPVLQRTNLKELSVDMASESLPLRWGRVSSLITSQDQSILHLENPKPEPFQLLDGEWYSEDYWCGEDQPRQVIDLQSNPDQDTAIVAVKTDAETDECVGTGMETIRGTFENGRIIGERNYVPPISDRRLTELYPDHPLDEPLKFKDPSIHPQMSLEGNWFVRFGGDTREPPAMVVLSKGGEYGCLNEDNWCHFERDPDAPWSLSYYQGPGKSNGAQSVEVSASGEVNVHWYYGTHYQWGGRSTISPLSEVSMFGKWRISDTAEGVEHWYRIPSAVRKIGVVNGDIETEYVPGDVPIVETEYANHVASMRGNRASVTLNLYGPNLWGRHYVALPWSSDMEVSGFRYICDQDGEAGNSTHWSWELCMERGGVKGISVSLVVWPRAYSGRHVLRVDEQEIPFELVVHNEPIRDQVWQPMEMEMMSCSVLQEVNRDWHEHPIRLVRHDPYLGRE